MRLLPYDPYEIASPVESMVWDGPSSAVYWDIVDPISDQGEWMRAAHLDTAGGERS